MQLPVSCTPRFLEDHYDSIAPIAIGKSYERQGFGRGRQSIAGGC
jgi:hypothetical protein